MPCAFHFLMIFILINLGLPKYQRAQNFGPTSNDGAAITISLSHNHICFSSYYYCSLQGFVSHHNWIKCALFIYKPSCSFTLINLFNFCISFYKHIDLVFRFNENLAQNVIFKC